jgi:hypothetical protein
LPCQQSVPVVVLNKKGWGERKEKKRRKEEKKKDIRQTLLALVLDCHSVAVGDFIKKQFLPTSYQW